MTDPYADYMDAAVELDTHLNNCVSCAIGRGCPTGDDLAEQEFRADRKLLRRREPAGEEW